MKRLFVLGIVVLGISAIGLAQHGNGQGLGQNGNNQGQNGNNQGQNGNDHGHNGTVQMPEGAPVELPLLILGAASWGFGIGVIRRLGMVWIPASISRWCDPRSQ